MLDRVIPPDLIWPSVAAEVYRVRSHKESALKRTDGPVFQWQYKDAQEELVEAVATGGIEAVFLVASDGSQMDLPPQFWYSDQQVRVWHQDYFGRYRKPVAQWWAFGSAFQLVRGFALVKKFSLHAFFDERGDGWNDELPPPLDGESQQDYVVRALNATKPRKITKAEARLLAKQLLRARGQSLDQTKIESLAESLSASMRALAKGN